MVWKLEKLIKDRNVVVWTFMPFPDVTETAVEIMVAAEDEAELERVAALVISLADQVSQLEN